ncbi:SpoIIE family protein phosphatase [Myxococcus qinghaiensis]|uniref:SpoIIE family protein phosphatase n=1 Tax=Myxococcus qinghaiensis TaxID=2906758 RepID=UPI0020A81EAF|nr:SpoIIE family protein phosphatase [Myxococcus qinghaiensis]MCP3161376.1 serine/threonine-protein phosphatase [Myxococcus qinghaiensis]
MRLSVAHLTRPKVGEVENGDGVVVRVDGPYTLLAVVDALGHGPAAAQVTAEASRCLGQTSLGPSVEPLMEALHAALRHGRGAAIMLAVFDGLALHCGGVGNVELRTVGTRVPVLPTPGILGQAFRTLRTVSTPLSPGDRLALFTDGLSFRLDLEQVRTQSPDAACALLLERFGRATDDATVLVADVEP